MLPLPYEHPKVVRRNDFVSRVLIVLGERFGDGAFCVWVPFEFERP